MANDSVLQVRMDSALKKEVEQLYRSMGTTFPEAVRLFAQQSLLRKRLPFDVVSEEVPFASAALPERKHGEGLGVSGFGMFSHVSDPDRRALEKSAWQNAVALKHGGAKGSK